MFVFRANDHLRSVRSRSSYHHELLRNYIINCPHSSSTWRPLSPPSHHQGGPPIPEGRSLHSNQSPYGLIGPKNKKVIHPAKSRLFNIFCDLLSILASAAGSSRH